MNILNRTNLMERGGYSNTLFFSHIWIRQKSTEIVILSLQMIITLICLFTFRTGNLIVQRITIISTHYTYDAFVRYQRGLSSFIY